MGKARAANAQLELAGPSLPALPLPPAPQPCFRSPACPTLGSHLLRVILGEWAPQFLSCSPARLLLRDTGGWLLSLGSSLNQSASISI